MIKHIYIYKLLYIYIYILLYIYIYIYCLAEEAPQGALDLPVAGILRVHLGRCSIINNIIINTIIIIINIIIIYVYVYLYLYVYECVYVYAYVL